MGLMSKNKVAGSKRRGGTKTRIGKGTYIGSLVSLFETTTGQAKTDMMMLKFKVERVVNAYETKTFTVNAVGAKKKRDGPEFTYTSQGSNLVDEEVGFPIIFNGDDAAGTVKGLLVDMEAALGEDPALLTPARCEHYSGNDYDGDAANGIPPDADGNLTPPDAEGTGVAWFEKHRAGQLFAFVVGHKVPSQPGNDPWPTMSIRPVENYIADEESGDSDDATP